MICDEFNEEAYRNAIGTIYLESMLFDSSIVEPVPAASLSPRDYRAVQAYFKSTEYELYQHLRIGLFVVDHIYSFNGRNLLLVLAETLMETY